MEQPDSQLMMAAQRGLSRRFLNLGQAAPGDDALAVSLGDEHAGGRITKPGGGAGDECDRMFNGCLCGTETKFFRNKSGHSKLEETLCQNI
jgi:hypothetical protein